MFLFYVFLLVLFLVVDGKASELWGMWGCALIGLNMDLGSCENFKVAPEFDHMTTFFFNLENFGSNFKSYHFRLMLRAISGLDVDLVGEKEVGGILRIGDNHKFQLVT